MKNFQPKDLDDAVDHILSIISQDEKSIEVLEKYDGDEDGFSGELHMFFGRNIRNEWNLWWYQNHNFENWPKEIPEIVKYFNDIKIYHADDMSGIILTTVYRKFFNLPIDLDDQIKKYHAHWFESVGDINPMK